MSLRLPLQDSKARELFDVAHLAEITSPENRSNLPTYRESIRRALCAFVEPGVKAVHTICLRADGELWLIRVGPKGGVRREWNFGKLV